MPCDLKSYPLSYYATYSLGTSALYYTPFTAINDGWLENKFSYKFGFYFFVMFFFKVSWSGLQTSVCNSIALGMGVELTVCMGLVFQVCEFGW